MKDLYSATTGIEPLRHSEIVAKLAEAPILDGRALQRSAARTISNYFRNELQEGSQQDRRVILGVANRLSRAITHMVDYVSTEDDSVPVPDIDRDFQPLRFATYGQPRDEIMRACLTKIPEVICYRRDDELTAYLFRIGTTHPAVQLVPELQRWQKISGTSKGRLPAEMAVSYELSFAAYESDPQGDS